MRLHHTRQLYHGVACGLWYTLVASVYYRTLRAKPSCSIETAPLVYTINHGRHGTTLTCSFVDCITHNHQSFFYPVNSLSFIST